MSRLFRFLLLLAGALIAIARYSRHRNREQQQPFFADAHRAPASTPSVAPEAVMEPDEDSFVADVGVRGPFALEDEDAAGEPFAAEQLAPKTETWSGRDIGS